jgi:hypothetical protein
MTPATPRPRHIALCVELLGVDPLVWRRVFVSDQWTLASLHSYLQWLLGWNDSHAHEFEVGAAIVAPAWWIEEMSLDMDTSGYRDERRVPVAAVLAELGARGEFEYRYDMGDGWQLRIVFEQPSQPIIEELPLPRCVAGENAGPPDDVGGPPGYEMFLEALADRRHEEHLQMMQWIGGAFDPKGFDLNHINRDWNPKRRATRRH